ncbi:MAG: M50 family metallopeptidase [Bacteroidota bacterium]
MVPPAILYFSYHDTYGLDTRALIWYSTVSALLFSFILIHELGHALMAKNRGVVAEKIILFPLGGGAFIPEQPKQTWNEVLVYAAGPGANLLLAAITLPVLLSRPEGELLLRYYLQLSGNLVVVPSLLEQVLGLTIAVNILLAIGNLLPAYPLDGGRILRALLRNPMGKRKATVVVTFLGLVIGLLLIGLAYYLSDPLLALGALFIIVMSALEYRNGWQRRLLATKGLKAVLRPVTDEDPLRVYPTETVASVKERFASSGWPVLPVFNRWNNLEGFVEASILEEESNSPEEAVLPYCEKEFTTARPEEDLLTVTERVIDADVYGAAVYGPRGQLIGYVFTEDIMSLLDTPMKRLRRRVTT